MSGCWSAFMMFVITQMSSLPRCSRNGRTSRNFRRGTISSLALTSSMNTRLTGCCFGVMLPHSQSATLLDCDGFRPQRAPAASRRMAW